MKNMKFFLAMAAAALLVPVNAHAILTATVTFTEAPNETDPIVVTSSGFTSPLSTTSPEFAFFIGTGGTLGTGSGYIAYWEDAAHTILSDYVTIEVVSPPTPSQWRIGFHSNTEGATLALPTGFTLLADVTETAGMMNTPVTLGGQTIIVGVDSGVDVPDGGLTAMLLGMGMLGLGWVRRMVK